MTPADKATISQFLQAQPLASIATVAPGSPQPEAALVAFAQTGQLELIFETFVNSRKWHNLQANPHVSFVIGGDARQHITLQYEGIAQLVPADEAERYIAIFLAKDTPCTEQFLRDPRARLLLVRPTWLRYTDYTQQPPQAIEQQFA